MGGRAVEGARLESAYTSKAYRGFESHLIRQIIRNLAPRKPAGQRYPHRFFAKFIRPACAHGSSPLLHNM
jgi:hypothetical protein